MSRAYKKESHQQLVSIPGMEEEYCVLVAKETHLYERDKD